MKNVFGMSVYSEEDTFPVLWNSELMISLLA
jgi:hypothetical protein